MPPDQELSKPIMDALARAAAGNTAPSAVEPSTERVELRAKHLAFLDQVWTEPRVCPIDGTSQWGVGQPVESNLRVLEKDLTGPSGRVYVMLPVSCQHCGYTIFFHTGMLEGETRGAAEAEE
jgi:hypothetical protein